MYPEINLFGTVVPTYFAWLSLVYTLMIFATVRKAELDIKHIPRSKPAVTPVHALNVCFWIMVPAFVGARLLHVAWESPEIYAEDWTRIFMVWNGGFVYYGGFAAAVAGVYGYARWNKKPFFLFGDFLAPLAAFGYGWGRFACFLAGCCYGEYCDLAWAAQGRNPVQIYSLVLEVTHGLVLWWLSRRPFFAAVPGRVSAVFLIVHGSIRFVLEFYRADFRGEFIAGLSISSWISLVLIAAGAMILLTRKPTPGH